MDNQQQDLECLIQDILDIKKKLTIIEQRLVVALDGKIYHKKHLRDYIVEILENSNEPLTAKEIEEFLKEAGYSTKALAKHMRTIILNCLRTHPEFVIATRRKSRPIRYAVLPPG